MSRSDLLLRCTYPFADAIQPPERERTNASLYGQAFHAGMEAYLRGQPLGPIANKYGIGEIDLQDNVELAGKKLVDYLGGGNDFGLVWEVGDCMLERSFAYSPEGPSARTTAGPDEAQHRYLEAKPGELPGTADLVCLGGPGKKSLLVMDYKTGLDASLESARAQILSLALAADWLYRPDEVVIAVLHAPRGGIVNVYDARLEPGDLPEHRSQLFRQMSRINDGSLRPGDHCQYCPARPICPAKDADIIVEAHAMVPALLTEANTLMTRPGDQLALPPTEYLGRIHQMVSLYDRLRDRLREAMFEETKRLGYGVRPDGRLVFVKKSVREQLSKASMERAIGKKRAEREIERLRGMGCVELVEREELRAEYEK